MVAMQRHRSGPVLTPPGDARSPIFAPAASFSTQFAAISFFDEYFSAAVRLKTYVKFADFPI